MSEFEPIVDVLPSLILGNAVALLQLAFELLALAVDGDEVVITLRGCARRRSRMGVVLAQGRFARPWLRLLVKQQRGGGVRARRA